MGKLFVSLLRLRLALIIVGAPASSRRRSGDRRDDRGDVPGWVLVTIMTVGLMAAISALAGDQLTSMLQSALNSVK